MLPLQYPFYQPGAEKSGKGWFLTLLLQSKPLFHAVLTIAASHRRTLAVTERGRVGLLIQQEEHLKNCLDSLNQAAQAQCPRSGLGVLAGVIQIMFFEVCRRLHGICFLALTDLV